MDFRPVVQKVFKSLAIPLIRARREEESTYLPQSDLDVNASFLKFSQRPAISMSIPPLSTLSVLLPVLSKQQPQHFQDQTLIYLHPITRTRTRILC